LGVKSQEQAEARTNRQIKIKAIFLHH